MSGEQRLVTKNYNEFNEKNECAKKNCNTYVVKQKREKNQKFMRSTKIKCGGKKLLLIVIRTKILEIKMITNSKFHFSLNTLIPYRFYQSQA